MRLLQDAHLIHLSRRAKQQGLLEGRKAPMQLTQRAASRSQGFGLPGFSPGEVLPPLQFPSEPTPSSFSGRHVFPPAPPPQGALGSWHALPRAKAALLEVSLSIAALRTHVLNAKPVMHTLCTSAITELPDCDDNGSSVLTTAFLGCRCRQGVRAGAEAARAGSRIGGVRCQGAAGGGSGAGAPLGARFETRFWRQRRHRRPAGAQPPLSGGSRKGCGGWQEQGRRCGASGAGGAAAGWGRRLCSGDRRSRRLTGTGSAAGGGPHERGSGAAEQLRQVRTLFRATKRTLFNGWRRMLFACMLFACMLFVCHSTAAEVNLLI